MPSLFSRLFSAFHANPPAPEECPIPVQVDYDADGLTQTIDGHLAQSLKWSELEFITIHVEDDLLPFPFWYVGNREVQLRIPNDAEGAEALFFDGFPEYLAGYRNKRTFAMITEASIALEGSFLIWESQTVTCAQA